jgi:hypothetical protein
MIRRPTSACFLIWALLTTGIAAGFDVPNWVFKSDRFDEARVVAEREKKCLILVFSNTKLSGSEEPTKKCLARFKSLGVVVFIDGMEDPISQRVYPYAWTALHSPEMTAWIPRVLAATADTGGVVATLSKLQMDAAGGATAFKDQVEAYRAGKRMADFGDGVEQSWKKPDFSAKLGSFVSAKGGVLTLRYKGKDHQTPLAEFETRYAEYARYLEIRSRKPEPWTSPGGKSITGVLLSLTEKEATLRLADGKVQTFPVTRLSPESLKRAKEIEGIE